MKETFLRNGFYSIVNQILNGPIFDPTLKKVCKLNKLFVGKIR